MFYLRAFFWSIDANPGRMAGQFYIKRRRRFWFDEVVEAIAVKPEDWSPLLFQRLHDRLQALVELKNREAKK